MNDLKDKTVLITGASTGIGAGCARALGALGAKVAVHYNRSKSAADEVVADILERGGAAFALQGDLRHSAQCERVVSEAAARWGRVDVLINNAGTMLQRLSITELTDESFDDIIDLNVRSMMMCTKHAVGHMKHGGSIINVTSVAAHTGGGPGALMYAGTKGFISVATKGLARELVSRNIRVNAVAPGVIQTPLHAKFSTPQQLETLRQGIPMARLGTVDECTGAFVYLASEQLSGYVTGQVLEVNGGQYMP
ncbi:3-oxoacyl-[acyl-carrier-protein] reductase FabG [Pigmentiphaga humi]|uniref:3-oxoacyl-[acyl-carrier-protein] reductase FabG n=1 Tax=Pigmentiphaga humi TaxID=2478468 RepID=A0A3P4B3M6_9BURK|nr:glucose 1-dehydrogenase [Pigmentiphaga humi]VCU70899.1 3-oxoacyl-[acyl-carrier-protein] reductase FabG [Pigmentiphaga humi]